MNLQWLLATSLLAVLSWTGGQQSTSAATCPKVRLRVGLSAA